MKRTSASRLALLVVGGYLIAWPVDLLLLELLGGFAPIGVSATILIAFSALALALWGWSIKDRLPRHSKDDSGNPIVLRATQPLPPLTAARTLAVALAASRVGSLCSGIYAGLATAAVLNLHLQISREHLLVAAVTALASVLLAATGVWVERLCALPPSGPGAEAQAA